MKSHIPLPPTYTQSFPCCSHYTSVWCFCYNWFKKQCRYIVVVWSPSRVQLFAAPWTAIHLDPLTISQNLPKFMSIVLVMPSNHLILCCPLLFLPSIFSSIRVFSNESAVCIRWPKYWNFNFSTSPSKEYSGLISIKIVWFDLFTFQGTLTSLL